METIKIKSGKITFSDPCYGLNTCGMLKNIPFPNGEYRVDCIKTTRTAGWGLRVKEIIIYNVDKVPVSESREMDVWWNALSGEVGVDSGQAGIFDSKYYEQYHEKNDIIDERWYDNVCNLTLSSQGYGTIDNQGVCSSSGYGDGGYTAYIGKLNTDIVAAKIVFIPDEDLDDTEENWIAVQKELNDLEKDLISKEEFEKETDKFITDMKQILDEIKQKEN